MLLTESLNAGSLSLAPAERTSYRFLPSSFNSLQKIPARADFLAKVITVLSFDPVSQSSRGRLSPIFVQEWDKPHTI